MKRLLIAFVLVVASSLSLFAQERILDYHSDITVHQSGAMTVVETIQVVAEGDQIKRGIYRDFPTVYHRGPLKVTVPFEVTSVERDGQSEPWHTQKQSNGVRLYVGDANRYVEKGEHTYTIHYTTDQQLGFFKDHDELYWNVTGNGWAFSIEKASATVHLPDEVPLDKVGHEAYTGRSGAKGKDYTSRVDQASRTIEFETTSPLGSHEGLTIVVTWPKGFVRQPTAAEEREALLRSNPEVPWAVGFLFVIVLYYVLAWLKVGRDPKKGTIIPEYGPPDGIGPGNVRHIHEMGFDKTCFAVAVIDMAVKGFLRIDEEGGEYTLEKKDDSKRSTLTQGERGIADALLRTSSSFTIKQSNWQEMKSAVDAFSGWLKVSNEGRVFLANRKWIVPGVILSFIAPIVTGLHGPQPAGVLFMSIWLSIWSLGVVGLVAAVVAGWRAAFHTRGVKAFVSAGGAIFLTAFSLPFIAGELFGMYFLQKSGGTATVVLLLALLVINAIFITLMKAPTVAGRKLMDRIDGFKMYLSTAESDRVKAMQGPAKTPELFERFLPYAIALGVENEWAKMFESVLAAAEAAPGGGYRPSWYSGTAFTAASAAGFASSIGSSMSSAISSSSSAPGSSSGSGGGGSSGGGGGGGGGGGW